MTSTLADAVGDLHAHAQRARQEALPSYELDPERRYLRANALWGELERSRRVDVIGGRGSDIARVVRELARPRGRVVVFTADATTASQVTEDVAFFLGKDARVLTYLPPEQSPHAEVNPERRATELRLATLRHLAFGEPFDVLVAPLSALHRRVISAAQVRERSLVLSVDQEILREELTHRLVRAGYVRTPLVDDPGTFAVRGAMVDLWPGGERDPVRLEFLGDGILSIKAFHADSQRSKGERQTLVISPIREADPMAHEAAKAALSTRMDAENLPTAKSRALLTEILSGRPFPGSDAYLPAFGPLVPLSDYLTDAGAVVLEDPVLAVSELRRASASLTEDWEVHKTPALELRRPVLFTPEDFTTPASAVEDWLRSHPVLLVHRLAVGGTVEPAPLSAFEACPPDAASLGFEDVSELERAIREARSRGKVQSLGPLCDRLSAFAERGYAVLIVAHSANQEDRLSSMLVHRGLTPKSLASDAVSGWIEEPRRGLYLAEGSLARGLIDPFSRVVFIPDEAIFGTRSHRGARRRKTTSKTGKSQADAFIEDLKTLAVGDFVVHVEHGIGRYLGLVHRDVGAIKMDFVAIEYAQGDKLYLPVYRLNQVQKFSGGEGAPKIDRLGGQTFSKTKARASREIKQLADELLRLYAERRAISRPQVAPADDDYAAFEATFPFDETDDQRSAIDDVLSDLERPYPMDRLVCGDVGFGKTEVAMRAAFRVATSGHQIAVLCPTTVLAQQHFHTFVARFQNHPISVRLLSRFASKSEEDDTVKRIKAGTVDIVIGTHRLLSKDIHWKKLGLLVIDEEQRFGVGQKERIKQLRTAVDVLTLSATPIPRTLQMATSGVREMSIITTPPSDRRAIRTLVIRDDASIIREAITRELERDGQVFYVHNRVEGLYERAAKLADLIPGARIAVVHGQLGAEVLERTMMGFVEGEFDILCATAIIESGLDIPRANTVIIDRADMFGLAQLYQLRGRVGRARDRAYCYLLVPPENLMTEESRARIEAIERHSELGAGFKIAALDMELRGSGDVLGRDQSGAVSAVGFEMFCSLMEDAVAELRGETLTRDIDPEVTVDDEALLPDDYIDEVGLRLSLYKRFAIASSDGEIDDLATEMEDRFGSPPESARRYLRLMRLKVRLRSLRILGCEASRRIVTLHLGSETRVDLPKLLGLVQVRRSPFKITPDMRLVRRFAEEDLPPSGLEAVDVVLGELRACLTQEPEGMS